MTYGGGDLKSIMFLGRTPPALFSLFRLSLISPSVYLLLLLGGGGGANFVKQR